MKKSIKHFYRGLMAGAVFLFAMSMPVEAKNSDVIPTGVYVDTIEISGMSGEEAIQAVESYVEGLDEKEITLNVMDEYTVVVTVGELGLKWKNAEIVEEAKDLGKTGNLLKRYKALKDLENQNKVFPLELTVDRSMTSQVLEEKCSVYNQEAKDATLIRENGSFQIQDGKEGKIVDVAASAVEIEDFLLHEWDRQTGEIEVAIKSEQPKGNKDSLLQVKDVIGTYQTSFSSGDKKRNANIANSTNLIDGTTLYPGEVFSTNEKMSPFTEANGYFPAGSYLNGMVVDSLGGGVCQVSTTLYNAVLLSELEIVERSNHSMIVGYVPPSADAAIAGDYKDFKFANNTDVPVYIEGYVTESNQVAFNIYGVETRPTNRVVSYESEVLSKSVPAVENIIQDAGKPVGFYSVQSAHIGYVARLWKVVTVDGVQQSRDQINKSTYKESPRTATIGIASPDPNVTAAMQAAAATGSIDYVKGVAEAYKAQVAAAQQPVPPQLPPPSEDPGAVLPEPPAAEAPVQ